MRPSSVCCRFRLPYRISVQSTVRGTRPRSHIIIINNRAVIIIVISDDVDAVTGNTQSSIGEAEPSHRSGVPNDVRFRYYSPLGLDGGSGDFPLDMIINRLGRAICASRQRQYMRSYLSSMCVLSANNITPCFFYVFAT